MIVLNQDLDKGTHVNWLIWSSVRTTLASISICDRGVKIKLLVPSEDLIRRLVRDNDEAFRKLFWSTTSATYRMTLKILRAQDGGGLDGHTHGRFPTPIDRIDNSCIHYFFVTPVQ